MTTRPTFSGKCFDALFRQGFAPITSHTALNHQANRALCEWLSDDVARQALYAHLRQERRQVLAFPSITHFSDDPAPRLDELPHQGHRPAYLVLDPGLIAQVLADPTTHSNRPYRLLGSGGFMLGLDPERQPGEVDWHQQQRTEGEAKLACPGQHSTAATPASGVTSGDHSQLIRVAIEQASVVSLAQRRFDLAAFAEQVALRYCGLLFGFSAVDHGLLQEAAAKAYRGLTYVNLGRHFVYEPDTLPAAQAAMARLARRADDLIREYDRLERFPDTPRPGPHHPRHDRAGWPEGVDPPSVFGMNGFVPLMKQWANDAGPLSGEQLATVVVGLLAGTVGNVQASVCIAVEALLGTQPTPKEPAKDKAFKAEVAKALAQNPPVAFLPRVTTCDLQGWGGHKVIPAGSDLILCLGAATATGTCPHTTGWDARVFGATPGATHACIGAQLAAPLVEQLVSEVLRLPGLARRLDPVTLDPLRLEKRWGFGCESFPLEYRRDNGRTQQPLQVVMRIKAPVTENAAALRRLIRDGAPRIERALNESGHVHFAWFQFVDNDTQLVLQTIYDGDFDAYIQHFALKVDDTFDALFRFIEDAPPLPVRDFPEAFVETIRRFNRAPASGYFYSAYPTLDVTNIRRPHAEGRS